MKLLICDDDISTIDVIESQLDYRKLGISSLLRAYNGQMAKEVIAREQPELILCDIGMPICSGIDVLKFIYENKYDNEFTFLTCYDDFEFAKSAIKYGATNYLTKPFVFSELEEALRGMISSYLETHDLVRNDALLNSALRQISCGQYGTSRSSISSLLRKSGLSFDADSRWYLAISCSDMTGVSMDTWNRESLTYSLSRLHNEILADHIGDAYTITESDDRFIWCVCFIPAGCDRQKAQERAAALIASCGEILDLRPVVLLSDAFPLYRAFDVQTELYAAVRKLRFYGGEVILAEEARAGEAPADSVDPAQIIWYLQKNDREGYLEHIGNLLGSRSSRSALDVVRLDLLNAVSLCLSDNGISFRLSDEPELSRLSAAAAASPLQLRSFASRLFDTAEERLQDFSDSRDSIVRVVRFIDAHFKEDIDRAMLASIAFITPNYLSKQFQARMGMNLREYINQLRVEEAKRLLLSTNASVSEIAGNVGYDNISYFSTIFRKHTGMSPIDWRETAKKEGIL